MKRCLIVFVSLSFLSSLSGCFLFPSTYTKLPIEVREGFSLNEKEDKSFRVESGIQEIKFKIESAYRRDDWGYKFIVLKFKEGRAKFKVKSKLVNFNKPFYYPAKDTGQPVDLSGQYDYEEDFLYTTDTIRSCVYSGTFCNDFSDDDGCVYGKEYVEIRHYKAHHDLKLKILDSDHKKEKAELNHQWESNFTRESGSRCIL